MTREQAIDIIKCLAWHTRPNEEDIEQAIKTLEQEPILSVLDMIRTEIKAKIIKKPWFDFTKSERDRNDAFLEVLDIINRYKAEKIIETIEIEE